MEGRLQKETARQLSNPPGKHETPDSGQFIDARYTSRRPLMHVPAQRFGVSPNQDRKRQHPESLLAMKDRMGFLSSQSQEIRKTASSGIPGKRTISLVSTDPMNPSTARAIRKPKAGLAIGASWARRQCRVNRPRSGSAQSPGHNQCRIHVGVSRIPGASRGSGRDLQPSPGEARWENPHPGRACRRPNRSGQSLVLECEGGRRFDGSKSRITTPRTHTGRMVGTTGFEPATSCSQSKCSTRLSYVPNRNSFTVRCGPVPGKPFFRGTAR